MVKDESGILEKSGYEAVLDEAGKLAIIAKEGNAAADSGQKK